MTKKDEILAMEAGDDLDALVAKEVMEDDLEHQWEEGPSQTGVKYCVRCGTYDWMPDAERPCSVMPYSRDISAAWQVWLAVTKDEPWGWAIYSDSGGEVMVEHYPDDYKGAIEEGCGDFSVDGLFPKAMCKAALIARLEKDNGI